MLFLIISPLARTIVEYNADDLADVYPAAGLDPLHCDHGYIRAIGMGYIVHEFGLFTPVSQQRYFGMCGRLIAGTCIAYAADDIGETVSIDCVPLVTWFGNDQDAIERAIWTGAVQRPVISANGIVTWHWPEPAPKGMMRP